MFENILDWGRYIFGRVNCWSHVLINNLIDDCRNVSSYIFYKIEILENIKCYIRYTC